MGVKMLQAAIFHPTCPFQGNYRISINVFLTCL